MITLDHARKLFAAGRLDEAQSFCLDTLAKNPDQSDALNLLGMIEGRTGRMDAAIGHFRQALVGAPDNTGIQCNLAEVLLRNRRPDEALEVCQSGQIQHPQDHLLNGMAAELLIRLGQYQAAIPHLFIALRHAPAHEKHWMRLNKLLSKISLEPATGRPWLLSALRHRCTRPREILGSIVATLGNDPGIARLLDLAARGELPRGKQLDDTLSQLGRDELLQQLMVTTFIPPYALERCFTGLRRNLLLDIDSHGFSPRSLNFSVALAVQSFLTDYAWFLTEEEEKAVDWLAERLDAALRNQESPAMLSHWLAIVGAYRPLSMMNRYAEIGKRDWPEPIEILIRMQIAEPIEERDIRARIPALTPVSNPVSLQVRAQYEENPYPRWVKVGNVPIELSLPHLLAAWGGTLPADPSFSAPEALIAGCGTGQQSINAAFSYMNARILAIDLSLTSLSYAVRKTREHGIGNIDYRHGDIMELAGLGRSFHVIECTGVLHHLADPIAGWRILVERLHTGGGMFIALYSELARRMVVAAREYITRKGYATTAADIRRFRRDLLDMPNDHPIASLRQTFDFFNISECRDALFHVQEHRFTLPQIKKALDDLGLRFLGFNLPDTSAYSKRFPDDPRMASLDHWHELEQDCPDTFINMYQFWVQKI